MTYVCDKRRTSRTLMANILQACCSIATQRNQRMTAAQAIISMYGYVRIRIAKCEGLVRKNCGRQYHWKSALILAAFASRYRLRCARYSSAMNWEMTRGATFNAAVGNVFRCNERPTQVKSVRGQTQLEPSMINDRAPPSDGTHTPKTNATCNDAGKCQCRPCHFTQSGLAIDFWFGCRTEHG